MWFWKCGCPSEKWSKVEMWAYLYRLRLRISNSVFGNLICRSKVFLSVHAWFLLNKIAADEKIAWNVLPVVFVAEHLGFLGRGPLLALKRGFSRQRLGWSHFEFVNGQHKVEKRENDTNVKRVANKLDTKKSTYQAASELQVTTKLNVTRQIAASRFLLSSSSTLMEVEN